ncbi:CBN-COGC-1 protein [Caenorhabditis brenneri]|uniref:Conserved oligomeric Golgi complex subunit 1 n=1 Tax=Caenorhabditis brenneri TaxID=135651 RepID=G0PC78_CAEBE|nr:CBN-COGC-1 protein [Caenorhabditis brenneri]
MLKVEMSYSFEMIFLVISQDIDVPKIGRSDRSVQSFTIGRSNENSIKDFCEVIIDEHVTASNLAEYLESLEGGMYALRLVLEFQTVELPDVGEVTVPIALSPAIQTILFDISTRLAEASVSHLLTKKIRKRLDEYVSNRLAELIGNRIEELKDGWNLPTRSTLQVLFDCQLLCVMFPGEKLRSVCSSIESHLDPFDVSLLSPLLSMNVKLVYTRTQVLFSCLVADTMSSKEVQLPQSFSKVQDLAVHIEQPSRIPMVPRLDRTMSVDKKNGGPRLKSNKYLANPSQQGKFNNFRHQK